jgi:hypothetical protein
MSLDAIKKKALIKSLIAGLAIEWHLPQRLPFTVIAIYTYR